MGMAPRWPATAGTGVATGRAAHCWAPRRRGRRSEGREGGKDLQRSAERRSGQAMGRPATRVSCRDWRSGATGICDGGRGDGRASRRTAVLRGARLWAAQRRRGRSPGAWGGGAAWRREDSRRGASRRPVKRERRSGVERRGGGETCGAEPCDVRGSATGAVRGDAERRHRAPRERTAGAGQDCALRRRAERRRRATRQRTAATRHGTDGGGSGARAGLLSAPLAPARRRRATRHDGRHGDARARSDAAAHGGSAAGNGRRLDTTPPAVV